MRRLSVFLLACVLALGVSSSVAPIAAQGQTQPAPGGTFDSIVLVAGRSRVLTTDFDVVRLAVTNPAVADATVIQAREILIDGKGPGTVSLILWGADRRVQYDVTVGAPASSLQEQLRLVFPGEDIRVSVSDEVIVLAGTVSSSEIAVRANEVAAASSSKARVVNMLRGPSGPDSQQVMLEVHFAEVERNAMLELGGTLLASRPSVAGRVTTEQFPSPTFERDVINFQSYLNLFLFLNRDGLGAVVRALQQRGLFQSLAEPTLMAYSGQEASFLAGGEFPIPIVQGGGGTAASSVTVQFKEFGVRLTFKPTIIGDVIRLKVNPEVSTLDFVNGVSLQGFRVPALKTRRAETEVELRDGQSFAIAGLLDNQSTDDRRNVPVLSSLPIVGHFFKSQARGGRRTELLVLITPRLVRPLTPDQVPPLPVDPSKFLPPEPRSPGAPGVTP